jgi:glyoxylase-like metal-dependent hydrolase (beta-lactamase superfamily II)
MWALRRTLIAVAIVGTLIAVGHHVLLGSGEVPALSTYALDLSRLRSTAGAPDAELPIEVRVEVIARSRVPRGFLVAGESLVARAELVTVAYQVVYPDQRSVIIDAGADQALFDAELPGTTVDADAHAAVQRALPFAEHVVVTHEHFDHLGGVARSPHFERIAPKVRLTTAQLDNTAETRRAGLTPQAASQLSPLQYAGHHRLAPGVVLVAAPGHTPGSQMVFVKLRDGRELLLLGDVAWHRDGIELPRARPWVASRFVLGEDREAVNHQLRALHELRRQPVHLVVAHDGEQLRALLRDGLLTAGFR